MGNHINNTYLKDTYWIEDEISKLKAAVLPGYGGRIFSVSAEGKEIIFNAPELLGEDSLFSGGIPVLFPFSSKTENDTYQFSGKDYYMPKHGFVMDMPFGIREKSDNSVTLTLKSDDFTKTLYPFEFELVLNYAISKKTFFISSEINNLSTEDMPYYIGWHPFFRTSDKSRLALEMKAEHVLDFIKGGRGLFDKPVDLSEKLDHVYYPVKGGWRFVNEADGYEVRIRTDELHDVAVVATIREGCVCVEPWTGLPNAINSGERLHWIKPGDSVICGFEMDVLLTDAESE